jgi:hypothetical protein
VAVVAVLSLSATLPVLAQEPTSAEEPAAQEEITVSLALRAPPRCGSESDLASRIAWRTSRVRIVPVGSSERHLDVEIETTGSAATATLSLTLPNGRRATRVLKAATCDEAVDAAALVAAVTLDPTASTNPTPPPGAGASGAGGATAAGGTTATGGTAALPPEGQGGAPPRDSRSELSASVFVPLELVAGPAPTLLYGVGVGAMGVWERGSVLSPAARLSGAHFFGQEYQVAGGTAYFSLNVLNVDLCPARIGNETIGVFTCGSLAYGVLRAEGRQTNDAKDERLPWWVLGGTLVVVARPVPPLEVQLFGTLGSPLVSDMAFQFGCADGATGCEPNVFHEVPAVTAQGGFALGVFFR